MPLMVGLPNVGGGGVAAATGWAPPDRSSSTAPSAAIVSRAAQDLRGAPVIHPPDKRWLGQPPPIPATTGRGSLPGRYNTPQAGVSTRIAEIFARYSGLTPRHVVR